MTSTTKTVQVRDIYEAAYYQTQGAVFIRARNRSLPANKYDKKGRKVYWVIQMGNVPLSAIDDWKTFRAKVNAREYKNARIKLKNKVKKYLGQTYENRN